jgi:protoporphyrinogen oxidase
LLTKSSFIVDICIIGGGVSGLAAAITAVKSKNRDDASLSIALLETDTKIGGRVRSDYTDDGYILDRGFAVFIEEYPISKKLLDYDGLELQQFWPGARVKLSNKDELAAVSDPLRRKRDLWKAITSPVGSLKDKLRLAPLFYTVVTKSIEELFSMEETDTLSCLRSYNFSEEFIQSFFAPFLEGIYLTPLDKQSSRMFHFVFKMFAVGSAALPARDAGGGRSVGRESLQSWSGYSLRCIGNCTTTS